MRSNSQLEALVLVCQRNECEPDLPTYMNV
jgi:hypothetical protein